MVISWLRESTLGEDQGRGDFLDLRENIRMLASSKIKPGEADFVNDEVEIGVRRKK